jgi:NAD(P)-dependent dehydrogenase (short-subunit alcohol dehydrogenase family)
LELFDLSGQVALVTGSTKGLGRAIARRLAEHSARVMITARDTIDCEAAAADLNRSHGMAVAAAWPCDIADLAKLKCLVEETHRTFGRIDILVCNAALNPHRGPSASISDATFQAILEKNVIANNRLTQFVLPRMVADGGGSIVFIATTGAFRGSRQYGAYCISKAALVQMARNIAVEYGRHKVRAKLHRAEAGANRHGTRSARQPESLPRPQGHRTAPTYRRARRDCGRSDLPRRKSQRLHDRSDIGHRWRPVCMNVSHVFSGDGDGY